MSQLTSTVRTSRTTLRGFERAAVERARLALVPVRRVNAPRAPFAVLVFLILGAGVVGLLMFNTQMQQDSFYATRLQQQADRLNAQQESLQLELNNLRDPQHLASAARGLGMVQPPVPAQIDLRTGRIFGVPTPATRQDFVPINPHASNARPPFVPKPKVLTVTTTAKTGQTAGGVGPASTTTPPTAGRNKAGTAAQGVKH
jgi:cell division protein FtsB